MDDAPTAARDLIDSYWEGLLQTEPILGTVVGDERFDDQLPDPSAEGRAARERLHRDALAQLASLPRDLADEDVRLGLDILEAIADRDLAALDHRTDLLWAVSHLWGPAGLVGEIASLQRTDSPERVDHYVARLTGTPAFYDAAVEVMREGVANRITAPRIVVERAVGQAERIIAAGVEGSPALAPLAAGDDASRTRVASVVGSHLLPALSHYLDGLRDYLPHATETLGLHALPGGDSMYAAQILSWTTLPLEANEVHELGLQDLAKIQEERLEAASALGFADPEAAEAALLSEIFASPEELKAVAESQVARCWDAAPSMFGRLPSTNCEVRLVEAFREVDMPFAFYNPPTDDGSRPGVYYVNGNDLASKPRHHLASTTFHEASPGHHFQIALEQEFRDRPLLRRFGGFLAGSAFIEGWGLYSERLADEMDLFLDEKERLGMLDMQGMRAARLVVDTGLHALGWSRDRAISTLVDAGVSRSDAEVETDRYVTMPGQALTYKIGQFEIERQRAASVDREGADFSLPGFHDRLLSLGSLPLAALRRELER
jgi:uncharacterized protein (DUF885 family)